MKKRKGIQKSVKPIVSNFPEDIAPESEAGRPMPAPEKEPSYEIHKFIVIIILGLWCVWGVIATDLLTHLWENPIVQPYAVVVTKFQHVTNLELEECKRVRDDCQADWQKMIKKDCRP